jgi:type VI secretion system secreted protein VgrG
MVSQLTQDTRTATLEIPALGKNTLVLTKFHATEGLSDLFEFEIEAVSTQADIDFDKALGTNCYVKVQSYKLERIFNGVLVEVQAQGMQADLYHYRLILRPWLWLLSKTSDCRIFENKTALDIIQQVFKDRGFNDVQPATTKSYPQLEYCVQYRETDLAFVCRLMEQHGIYYFFEHSADKHLLRLGDAKSSHKPVPGLSSIPFMTGKQQQRRDQEHLFTWSPERRLRTGKIELMDYNYLEPKSDLKSDAEANTKYNKSKLEIYDYPGKYTVKKDGETYAKVRLLAEQALDQRRYATGDSVSLFAGGLVTLEKHPQGSENKEYLILRETHAFTFQAYVSGLTTGEDSYTGNYEFLPSDIEFKAPLITPRPIIYGPQTALVIADKDKDEEIDVDEYGRILVRFYWDRKKKQSCRVRVAQVWAGKNWGGQMIPRIGQEAVIEFLEGDPDRPLVVGTVYNADYKHPYDLPANKTQSGLKSDSSKGHNGYNEFMFEDKKNSEKIRMHGEKDHEVVIQNMETVEIGKNFSGKAPNSRTTTLKNGSDELGIQNGNQKIDIQGKQETTVLETISIEAMQKITLTVGASSITMDPVSITINSPQITVQSTIGTQIQGGAMLQLQAAIITIN